MCVKTAKKSVETRRDQQGLPVSTPHPAFPTDRRPETQRGQRDRPMGKDPGLNQTCGQSQPPDGLVNNSLGQLVTHLEDTF